MFLCKFSRILFDSVDEGAKSRDTDGNRDVLIYKNSRRVKKKRKNKFRHLMNLSKGIRRNSDKEL